MLLRRLLAAALALAIAVPLPAFAAGGCQMDGPMIAAEKCDCCTSPAAQATGGCATAMPSACDCSLRADTGSQPSQAAAASPTTVHFDIDVARIPARWSTPQRSLRAIDLAASPPGAGTLVSRPLLCTWTL